MKEELVQSVIQTSAADLIEFQVVSPAMQVTTYYSIWFIQEQCITAFWTHGLTNIGPTHNTLSRSVCVNIAYGISTNGQYDYYDLNTR
jgi:hypothetical protein